VTRFRLRTWAPKGSITIGRAPVEVEVPCEPGEHVAGIILPDASSGGVMPSFLLARKVPAEPSPYGGRLRDVLAALDDGHRISRHTWGACFLVIEDHVDGHRVWVWDPSPKGSQSPWRCRELSDLPLDTFDLLADDWYVVTEQTFARWSEDLTKGAR
jgi:hypothetical protein